MTPESIDEQLVNYLTDARAIEQQALVQMRAAPRLAGDERIAQRFDQHLIETEGHERIVAEQLRRLGAGPSKVRDLVGTEQGVLSR